MDATTGRPPATCRLASALPVIAVLGSMVSLGIGTSFAKTLFPLAGPEGTTFIRVGLAALILSAIHRPWRGRATRAGAGPILLYGAAIAGMNLLFYKALETLPFGLALAIEFVGPLSIAIFASRRWIDLFWAMLALAALALLLPIGSHVSIDHRGAGFALAAAVCWAVYILVGRHAGRAGNRAVASGMTVAALLVAPFGAGHLNAGLLAPAILATAIGIAILSSVIPYSLEMVALTRLPRRVFGILVSLEPAIGAVAALAVLGEHLSGRQWIAIAAVVIASAGSTAMAADRGEAAEGSAADLPPP